MRTNLFDFKKLKKNKIVLEEETIDNPFLLFFQRYGKYLFLLLMLLAIIVLGIALFLTIKDLKDTTKVTTNISSVVVEFDGDNVIDTSNMSPISGGLANKLFYDRYGNIGLTEGVIFVIKEVNSENGLITYYSDGSAKLLRKDGTLVRISSLENADYGIKENGKIIIGAKTKEIIVMNTKVLEDGTKIIYYSDNSCELIIPNHDNKILVRNSDRLVIEENRLIKIEPSGVSKVLNTDNVNGIKLTIKIEKGNDVYIVRNSEDINISNGDITFPNNNEATILKEISLKDGSKIIYYTDGSAEIIKGNDSIIVRESKDIIYTDERVVEIVETRYANETIIKETPNGKDIIYLDNGGALIKNPDVTYEYIDENSDIKYDDNGNIKEPLDIIRQIDKKVTPDGTIVIDLEDGRSIIIDENGYRIVETDDIVYDEEGNIVKIIGDEIEIPEEDEDKDDSVSDDHFVIKNYGKETIKYIVTIEASDSYKNYAPVWLDPMYLRYNMVINSKYLEGQKITKKIDIGTVLEGNTKIERETYILYEDSADITLGMWLDYTDITNDYQNSVFVGTITIYCETALEEDI